MPGRNTNRIPPENRPAFTTAIHAVEPVLRQPQRTRFVERYIIMSWAEYERLRSRMTIAEREFQAPDIDQHHVDHVRAAAFGQRAVEEEGPDALRRGGEHRLRKRGEARASEDGEHEIARVRRMRARSAMPGSSPSMRFGCQRTPRGTAPR